MADQIPIPQWEISELDTLSQQGDLYGIDPNILAVMSQAESGGEVKGAGINPEGYGGYFGLGQNTKYPGGTPSTALLETNSPASFAQQAQIAASDYASLWTGNAVTTENAYQGGTQGGQLMQAELAPSELGSGSNTPVPANGTAGGTGATLTGIASGGSSSSTPILSFGSLGSIGVPTGLISRAAIGIMGLILLYMAAKELFSDNGAAETVASGTQTVIKIPKAAVKKGGETAAVGAAA